MSNQTNEARRSASETVRSDPRSGDRFAVVAYLIVAVALVAVVALSEHLLDRWIGYPVARLHFPGDWLLEGWVRYDGNWYRDIVTNGYHYAGPGQQANVAYFPGYPMAMWVVLQVVRSSALAGIVVTFASGLVAAILLQRWAATRLDPHTARLAVVVMLLYPYAWYLFGAVYADALFLALALGAFLLLESGHPLWAGLLGALATGTRPIGIAVVVGLVLVTIERRGGFRRLRALRPADFGVLVSLAGFAGWSAYQGLRWNDPTLFSDIEGAPGWDQAAGPRTWLKVTFFQRLAHLPGWLSDSWHHTASAGSRPWTESAYTSSILLQALLLLGALLLVGVVWRRFGWGYAGYVLTIVAVSGLGTKDFLGVGRYLLGAFPLYAAAAVVLVDRPRVRRAALGISGLLLAVLSSAYARGYYLA